MTEANQNFGQRDDPFVKGDYKRVTINGTKSVPGPLTLTNKRWQAWRDGAVKIQKVDADISFTDIDDTTFRLEFDLLPADTSGLAAALYEHECEIVATGSKPATVTKGSFVLTDQLIV